MGTREPQLSRLVSTVCEGGGVITCVSVISEDSSAVKRVRFFSQHQVSCRKCRRYVTQVAH